MTMSLLEIFLEYFFFLEYCAVSLFLTAHFLVDTFPPALSPPCFIHEMFKMGLYTPPTTILIPPHNNHLINHDSKENHETEVWKMITLVPLFGF